jgi:hypothetical protein
VAASSNDTRCLRRLTAAFRASHSNTIQYIRKSELRLRGWDNVTFGLETHTRAKGLRRDRNPSSFMVAGAGFEPTTFGLNQCATNNDS